MTTKEASQALWIIAEVLQEDSSISVVGQHNDIRVSFDRGHAGMKKTDLCINKLQRRGFICTRKDYKIRVTKD